MFEKIKNNAHTILLLIGLFFLVFATFKISFIYGLYACGIACIILAILINQTT